MYFNTFTSKAQLPNLGTASGFALFTAVGAFNNLGDSYIIGDIGTNVGAYAGFPIPGTVNGQIHVADAISAQAAIDVNDAYTFLFDITDGVVISTSLGNDQILTPNVYTLGAAATISGNIILDGENNPDAIFIFQIDGALSINSFSKVVLINSASFHNVFWQVNGQFDLGESSVFKGTVITNGAINLLESSSIIGHGFSKAGAISLSNNLVNIDTDPYLPIELVKFTAISAISSINLFWATASESNNDFFTIEKSTDAINYEIVATIDGAGNSNQIIDYNFIDNSPLQNTSYYRLKQTDFNGIFTYSESIKVDALVSKNPISIYPNPFANNISISMPETFQQNNVELQIYNSAGKVQQSAIIPQLNNTIDMSSFESGIYYYLILVDSKVIQFGKLISQN